MSDTKARKKKEEEDKEIENKVHFEHFTDAEHVAEFLSDVEIEAVTTCYGYKGFTVFYKILT